MTRLMFLSDLHFGTPADAIGTPDNLFEIAAAPDLSTKLQILDRAAFLGSFDPALADAAKSFVSDNAATTDALFVLGDCATSGSEKDLVQAADWIRTLPFAGPKLVIPGNHDRMFPHKIDLYQPGNPQFDLVFPSWNCGQGMQGLWQGDGVTVLGADFSLRAGDMGSLPIVGHLGQGRVRPELVDALVVKSLLYGGTVLWAIHFEPGTADATLALLDEHLLAEGLAKFSPANMPTILCGHTHLTSRDLVWNGARVLCCGSTCQPSHFGNWINVVEIDGPNATLLPFRYDGTAFVA